MSEFLKSSSGIWSIVHILVLFMFFYKSRYSPRKTSLLTALIIGFLVVSNSVLYLIIGGERFSQFILFFLVVPSLLFFFILSKHRDFRFLFTFCIVDTISAEIIILSSILNAMITPESNIFMFVFRLIIFPVVEFISLKYLTKPYFEVQEKVKKGWGTFSLVSIIFYILILFMSSWPTLIEDRPNDFPVMLIILTLMPLMYLHIFQVLGNQIKLNTLEREHELWTMQSAHMQHRIQQMTDTEERVRMERHNLRHRLQTIDAMLQKGESDEARAYIAASQEGLEMPLQERWCTNAILDAVFSAYFEQAKTHNIRIESALDISDELPVDAAELSVVIANALENAIIACKQLPEAKRYIKCRCISHPQFMLQISNPYQGTVSVDEEGRPLATENGHGIGTRSILAFCEKNEAFVDYKLENNVFALRILIQK